MKKFLILLVIPAFFVGSHSVSAITQDNSGYSLGGNATTSIFCGIPNSYIQGTLNYQSSKGITVIMLNDGETSIFGDECHTALAPTTPVISVVTESPVVNSDVASTVVSTTTASTTLSADINEQALIRQLQEQLIDLIQQLIALLKAQGVSASVVQ